MIENIKKVSFISLGGLVIALLVSLLHMPGELKLLFDRTGDNWEFDCSRSSQIIVFFFSSDKAFWKEISGQTSGCKPSIRLIDVSMEF